MLLHCISTSMQRAGGGCCVICPCGSVTLLQVENNTCQIALEVDDHADKASLLKVIDLAKCKPGSALAWRVLMAHECLKHSSFSTHGS